MKVTTIIQCNIITSVDIFPFDEFHLENLKPLVDLRAQRTSCHVMMRQTC